MKDFSDFVKLLKKNVKDLAVSDLNELKDAAIKDGKDFIDSAEEDLERYTNLLVAKKITLDEFGFLLRGKKSLAKMEALKQIGLALAKIDRFRTSLLETITTTAFDFFLK